MKRLFLLSSLLFLLTACASTPSGPQMLTVMTHDSFAVSQSVVQSFEKANNAKISFLQSGDAGAALNKAILTKDAPLADVFYGVDNTFLSRALEGNIYEAYQSPALANVSAEFDLDPSHRAIPVDYGDVCINYDKVYFSKNNLTAPQTLEDLAKPEYKGLLVVENPATSSTGLAFLLATHVHFGNDYLKYWKTLKDNGVVVVDGWETAYFANFSGSSGRGPQPMVLSYASSPAAEVTPKDAPTASILGPDTCFRQIEFVGILRGTHQRALAEKFVDFMLGQKFQTDLPGQMFVYPVLPNVTLPDAFIRYAQKASQPAVLAPDIIAAHRDAWIQAWSDAVLK